MNRPFLETKNQGLQEEDRTKKKKKEKKTPVLTPYCVTPANTSRCTENVNRKSAVYSPKGVNRAPKKVDRRPKVKGRKTHTYTHAHLGGRGRDILVFARNSIYPWARSQIFHAPPWLKGNGGGNAEGWGKLRRITPVPS